MMWICKVRPNDDITRIVYETEEDCYLLGIEDRCAYIVGPEKTIEKVPIERLYDVHNALEPVENDFIKPLSELAEYGSIDEIHEYGKENE